MATLKISQLVILPGYNCGFKCAHCGVPGDRHKRLSEKEILLLHSELNRHKFRTVSFAGGEPTLYIPEINSVLAGVKDIGGTEIYITTNGDFGRSVEAAEKTISAFRKLDRLQLSYDRFHQEFLPFENIDNIFKSCRRLGVDFSVVLTIASPMDLALISKLRTIGEFVVGVQKVLPFGHAKDNGIDYPYMDFDTRVLDSFCPNRGKASYLCGQGFSLCDVLPFSFRSGHDTAARLFPTFEALLEDEFTRRMSRRSFSELMKESGLPASALLPRHSSPCTLCETILGLSRS